MTPLTRSLAAWRVASVQPEEGKRLFVRFNDGTEGRVDMRSFLASGQVDATVFAALRDDDVFRQVAVIDGSVRWPSGADLAPDTMYDAIRTTGCWHVN